MSAILKVKCLLLFSKLICREHVVWGVARVDAAIDEEICVSKRSLHKVVLHQRIDVGLVDFDELVTVGPHWC